MIVPRLTIHKQKRKFFFLLCFHIIMSFPASFDISQDDAEMLKEQHHEMQQ